MGVSPTDTRLSNRNISLAVKILQDVLAVEWSEMRASFAGSITLRCYCRRSSREIPGEDDRATPLICIASSTKSPPIAHKSISIKILGTDAASDEKTSAEAARQ